MDTEPLAKHPVHHAFRDEARPDVPWLDSSRVEETPAPLDTEPLPHHPNSHKFRDEAHAEVPWMDSTIVIPVSCCRLTPKSKFDTICVPTSLSRIQYLSATCRSKPSRWPSTPPCTTSVHWISLKCSGATPRTWNMCVGCLNRKSMPAHTLAYYLPAPLLLLLFTGGHIHHRSAAPPCEPAPVPRRWGRWRLGLFHQAGDRMLRASSIVFQSSHAPLSLAAPDAVGPHTQPPYQRTSVPRPQGGRRLEPVDTHPGDDSGRRPRAATVSSGQLRVPPPRLEQFAILGPQPQGQPSWSVGTAELTPPPFLRFYRLTTRRSRGWSTSLCKARR